MATSLKVNIESWNVLTAKWLRHTVYDRAPLWIRTWAVFCISAFWHGFYPGYYILFLTGAFATEAARLVSIHLSCFFHDKNKKKYIISELSNGLMSKNECPVIEFQTHFCSAYQGPVVQN